MCPPLLLPANMTPPGDPMVLVSQYEMQDRCLKRSKFSDRSMNRQGLKEVLQFGQNCHLNRGYSPIQRERKIIPSI